MQRVVLLGASNLTISIALVADTLRANLAAPLEIWAAHGHGRSYGNWSRVLGRSLPGISNCQLWDDLQARPAVSRTMGLITDIGNDLLYGADVPQIIEWVRDCLEKLRSHNADTVMTALPMDSVKRLSRARFYAARTLFFPASKVTYATMMQRVESLNEAIGQIATEFSATYVEPRGEWYGIDPIHVVRRHRATAWSQYTASWFPADHELEVKAPSVSRRLEMWRIRPAERFRFGVKQTASQPAFQFDEQSHIWMY